MIIDTDQARRLSLAEVKILSPGVHVFLPVDNTLSKHFGKLVEVRISGKPKTWKKNPDKVKVPYKYGLYDNGYITEIDKVYEPKD